MATEQEIEAAKAQHATAPTTSNNWSTAKANLTTYIDVIGVEKMIMHNWLTYRGIQSAIKYVAVDSLPNDDPEIPYADQLSRSIRVGRFLATRLFSDEYKNKFADDHGQSFISPYELAPEIPEPAYGDSQGHARSQWKNGYLVRLWLGWQGWTLKNTENAALDINFNFSYDGLGDIETAEHFSDIVELPKPSGIRDTFLYTYRILIKQNNYRIHYVDDQRDSTWRARAVGTLLYRDSGLTDSEAAEILKRGSVSDMANYVMDSVKYTARLKG